MKLITTCIISLSLISQLSYAQSEEKELIYYDVEVVIFKNLAVPKNPEKVLPNIGPEFVDNFLDLSEQDSIIKAGVLGYTIPKYEELRLTEAALKIHKSRRYKLLAHTAWRQPGVAREEALAIRIIGGTQFGSDYSSIDQAVIPSGGHPHLVRYDENGDAILPEPEVIVEETPQPIITNPNDEILEVTEEPKVEQVWYELEGKITIGLSRYLHAYTDLVLRIPNENTLQISDIILNPETQDEPTLEETLKLIEGEENAPEEIDITTITLNNYALNEHRRMRSTKLHYLDNPELGMLILITPYKAPEDEILEGENLELNEPTSTKALVK